MNIQIYNISICNHTSNDYFSSARKNSFTKIKIHIQAQFTENSSCLTLSRLVGFFTYVFVFPLYFASIVNCIVQSPWWRKVLSFCWWRNMYYSFSCLLLHPFLFLFFRRERQKKTCMTSSFSTVDKADSDGTFHPIPFLLYCIIIPVTLSHSFPICKLQPWFLVYLKIEIDRISIALNPSHYYLQ